MMTGVEFGEVYEKGYCRTVRALRYRGASLDRAEDLAQAAWLQGWRKLDQLRNETLLVSWINMIAMNFHRRLGPREDRYQALVEFDLAGGAEVDSAPMDVDRILQMCVPRDRALFEHQLDGLTTQEMAEQQGVSEVAIRLRLFRARRDVRSKLQSRAAALRSSAEPYTYAAA
ncbi:MAG: RNA polymerase sigma factor [Acidobacteriota bacterium]